MAVTDGTGQILAERYRLTDSIGRGGMADVYSAEDTHSKRMVAVKVMRVGEAADPERFAAEMTILERLEHPAIVRLFDTGQTEDESPYFVMQLVEGESLAVRLREEGPLPVRDAVKMAARVAGALAHAHDRGVVHRDVKPANILIDTAGRGFLTDFGVARLVDATLITRAGTTIGTAAYLAPEQMENSSVGPAADVYALGLVLIEVFSGRRAFGGTGVESAMARLGQDPAIPDGLPQNWVGMIVAMTRRDPARRPTAPFVEGVLRGKVPPPPLDPIELAARSKVRVNSDDVPTAVTPTTGNEHESDSSSDWGPPSVESLPPKPPPTPPPGDVTGERSTVTSAMPQPVSAHRLTRVLLAGVLMFLVAIGTVVGGAVAIYRVVTDDTSVALVTGDSAVDDAARQVIDVIDASEVLRASDPSLQRRLRQLSAELAGAVNDDEVDRALDLAVDMTNEVRVGIETLDINEVAFRSLLEALRNLTRVIQTEGSGQPVDGN